METRLGMLRMGADDYILKPFDLHEVLVLDKENGCAMIKDRSLKLTAKEFAILQLSQEADTIDGFTFVWFTDGIGWKSARGNLRETFEVYIVLMIWKRAFFIF